MKLAEIPRPVSPARIGKKGKSKELKGGFLASQCLVKDSEEDNEFRGKRIWAAEALWNFRPPPGLEDICKPRNPPRNLD